MQNVVSDKPYAFIPPRRGRWWPRLLQRILPWRLRSAYGINTVTCNGIEKLIASLNAGYGVLLTPNHCRPSDPEVIHEMLRRAGLQPYMMASWHLFMQNPIHSFLMRTTGTFSVYREGTDSAAVSTAIELLGQGGRPLVLFPEGVTTRANDRINPLLEGAAFIAHMAAKHRARDHAACGVVVHPIALRYRHDDNVLEAVAPVVSDIERKLSWRAQTHLPIEARLAKIGSALLALKEIEHFDRPQDGALFQRTERLIDGLLAPLEREWLHHPTRETHVVARVKALRPAVLHDMLHGDLSPDERARRWAQMADMALAQSISLYPPGYIGEHATIEHLVETVERLEEDLTDTCRRYAPLHVTVTVGDPIPVSPVRERGGHADPLLEAIETSLKSMLGIPQ